MEISHGVFIICCHFTLILNAQSKTKADDTVSGFFFLRQRSIDEFVVKTQVGLSFPVL